MALPLKIGILSFVAPEKNKKKLISTVFLQKTAQYRKHTVRIFHNDNFQFFFDSIRPQLLYNNLSFTPPDVMIIRPGTIRNAELELSTVRQLELLKIPVVNHYLPIVRAKNKVRTLQILSHHNIPLPKTVVLHKFDHLDLAIEQIGGFPIIMKTAHGSFGIGVSIIESSRSLRSMVDLLAPKFENAVIIMQEYVKEAKGKDIRAFVVDGKIIAAMERKAKRGEFRSNFHRGGSIALADLSQEEKTIALKAVKLVGLDVAGVDIIRTTEGPKILEVNSNPGLEGITEVTGTNVAEYIIRFAEKVVKQKRWLRKKKSLVIAA